MPLRHDRRTGRRSDRGRPGDRGQGGPGRRAPRRSSCASARCGLAPAAQRPEPDMPEALPTTRVVEVREPRPRPRAPSRWLAADHRPLAVFTQGRRLAESSAGSKRPSWADRSQLFRTMKRPGPAARGQPGPGHADAADQAHRHRRPAPAVQGNARLVQGPRRQPIPCSRPPVFGDDEIEALSAVAETRLQALAPQAPGQPRIRQVLPSPLGPPGSSHRLGGWDG